MKQTLVSLERNMQAAAESLIKLQIAKSPLSIKTLFDLVTLLVQKSRDKSEIVKIIQTLYSSDIVVTHLKSLPDASREKLDKFVKDSLVDFVELVFDTVPVPTVKTSWFSWFPLFCGGVAPVTVSTLAEEKMIAAVTDVKVDLSGAAVDLSGAAIKVVASVTAVAATPVSSEQTQQVAVSEETKAPVATVDVSGALVDATLATPSPTPSS
jgi:hypothetical protein